LDLWRTCQAAYALPLCGGPREASAKLRSMYARLLLGKVEHACCEWLARRAEEVSDKMSKDEEEITA